MNERRPLGLAGVSLILGITSLIVFPLGPITAISAIICGHIARAKIKAEPDNLKGEGKAIAGLIMGYIYVGVIALVIIIPARSLSSTRTFIAEAKAGCSYILTAERIHKAEHGAYIDVENPNALTAISLKDLQGRYFDHQGYSVQVIEEDTLIIKANANGTDKVVGDVDMTVSRGSIEWSGSLLE